jgi:hypothetical protein
LQASKIHISFSFAYAFCRHRSSFRPWSRDLKARRGHNYPFFEIKYLRLILPGAIERLAGLLSTSTASSGRVLIAMPTAPPEPKQFLSRILHLAMRRQNSRARSTGIMASTISNVTPRSSGGRLVGRGAAPRSGVGVGLIFFPDCRPSDLQ